jgi:hypothetical protein
MAFKTRIETKEFRDQLRRMKHSLPKRAEYVAELVAREVVQYARSYTEETKPGVNEGDGPRKLHPGGWADVRGQLKASIKARIERDGLTVKAVIEATAEYAAALDAKTGYDVLGGADEIARKAINKYGHLIFERV